MDCDFEFRPHVCELCSRGFKRRQVLKRHMGVHSNLRPFKCDFCTRSYKYKKGVNRHIKNKHIEKWHNLPITNRRYSGFNPYEHDIDIYLALDDSKAIVSKSKKARVKRFAAKMCRRAMKKIDG